MCIDSAIGFIVFVVDRMEHTNPQFSGKWWQMFLISLWNNISFVILLFSTWRNDDVLSCQSTLESMWMTVVGH